MEVVYTFPRMTSAFLCCQVVYVQVVTHSVQEVVCFDEMRPQMLQLKTKGGVKVKGFYLIHDKSHS